MAAVLLASFAYTKANIRMEDDVVVMVDAGVPVLAVQVVLVTTLLVRVRCMLIRLLVCFTSIPAQSATRLGWLLEPSLNVDS
jgi:hypothetical protein